MSNFLLEAGRQTLMLELQEASRLPERLGDDSSARRKPLSTARAN